MKSISALARRLRNTYEAIKYMARDLKRRHRLYKDTYRHTEARTFFKDLVIHDQ